MSAATIAAESVPIVTLPGVVVQPMASVGDPEEGRPGPVLGGDASDGGWVSHGDRGGALGSLPGYGPDAGKPAATVVPTKPSKLDRLLSSFRVRALLRRHATSPRIAKCGKVVHEDPTVVTQLLATGERQARWTGVVTCQRTGCPVCEAAKARKLGKVVRRLLGGGGTWQHVALTVPHTAGESWGRVYQRLLDGIRGLSHGRAGRMLRPLLLATVRATETTFSHRHGWHVHAHMLWRVRRVLTEEEEQVLAAAWSELTGAHPEYGTHIGRTYYAHTAGDGADYLAKLALEIAGAGKVGHGEHWTLGDLYQRAARGERVDLIQHYQTETRGKRLYQLDRRAKALHDEAPELADQVVVETWVTPIERHHFSALSRAEYGDPLACYLPLEVAIRARGDPSNDLEDTVFSMILASQGPPGVFS